MLQHSQKGKGLKCYRVFLFSTSSTSIHRVELHFASVVFEYEPFPSHSKLSEMAHGPRTIEESLKLGSSDLRFTLSRNDVSDMVQARFFEQGVTSTNKFASFFRDEADLTQVMADSFGLDAAESLQSRAEVASVICSWNDTRTKAKRQSEVEAEMNSREWTKPIPTGDYIQLRNSFTERVGLIEDKMIPAKEYLEKKLQELENGEFRAETLAEVVSKDEVDPDVLVPIFDAKGTLSVKKGSTTVPMPTGPEQLRRRLSVMQNCLMMLAIKHVHHEELKDVGKEVFEKYKDYLLGDYVWGLTSTDLQGRQIQTPPWSLVLAYEHAIRKRAYTIMQTEHLQLGAALQQAWKCPVTKERHFITPLALYAKRSYPNQDGDWDPKGKGKKGKGKGKSKGQGPKGEKICYRFNQGKCSYKKCKFEHMCNKCFQKGHNALNCKSGGPDTQGSG